MYGTHDEIPAGEKALLKELFEVDDLNDVDLDQINELRVGAADKFEELLAERAGEELDGDLETGLASAGWGTDEDYGLFADGDDYVGADSH